MYYSISIERAAEIMTQAAKVEKALYKMEEAENNYYNYRNEAEGLYYYEERRKAEKAYKKAAEKALNLMGMQDGNAYEYGVYFCKLGYRSEARFLCGAIRRAAVEMMGKIEDMQEENQ